MPNSKKVLLIGWDAADWKVINDLIDQGLMPHTQKLVEGGTMGNLRTLSPVLSPMLWTSIGTGKRPGKHGIYGFSEPNAAGTGVQPMNNTSRKCKAIWNILNQNDLRSLVVGWWPSHPAEPINGVMVSDFFHKSPKKPGDPWKLLPKCIHPEELTSELSELRVHPAELKREDILPFVPRGAEVDQDHDPRLSSVMKVLAECSTIHATATELLENQEWDFAAIYYDAIDHFCHGFMRYHPPQQPQVNDNDFRLYQNVVKTGYIYHDMLLGRLLELTNEDTTVMLISDHGFHPDHLRPKEIPHEPAGPAIEHRDYGIFALKGPGIRQDHLIHSANLLDITPTLLSLFGLPVAEDMDGKPLLDVFEEKPEIEWIASWEDIEGNDGRHPKDMVIDAKESSAALDQLVALGYIDAPDQDASKAVADTQRELDFNLARSYMDEDKYGEAIPLLQTLYLNYPLEFRFGIQLANCLRATGRNAELKMLLPDLKERWRLASTAAKEKLVGVVQLGKERKAAWDELKKLDDENTDENAPTLARLDPIGNPKLFEDDESAVIRKLRAIAGVSLKTLSFLEAAVASADGDFEKAAKLLEAAKLTKTTRPGFQYQAGNVFLGLEQYEKAEAAFKSGLSLDELDPNCLMGLCRTYIKWGKVRESLEYGQRAIGLKYRFPVAHYFYARAQNKSGDTDGAIDSLKTAIKQNPNFQEAHELLAKIYDAIAEPELAIEHRGSAKNLAEDNQEVIQEMTGAMEFPPLEEIDFEQLMPSLPSEELAKLGILPRLLQLPQKSITEEDQPESKENEIIVVSGLPRSGTSMAMQMLAAAGLEIYTDNQRKPDENNPKGYFEADTTKGLVTDNAWVKDCRGKVIKVVSPVIPFLPQQERYRVLFMNRKLKEVVASQNRMLERLDKQGGDIGDKQMEAILLQQLMRAAQVVAGHGNPLISINYENAIEDPENTAKKIAEFLEMELDIAAMVAAVDASLHREKA